MGTQRSLTIMARLHILLIKELSNLNFAVLIQVLVAGNICEEISRLSKVFKSFQVPLPLAVEQRQVSDHGPQQ